MKILIVYASKSGTTLECVKQLVAMFTNVDIEIVDIDKESPSLDEYEVVIFGAGIRMSKIPKSLYRYIAQNEQTLLKKQVSYFLCMGVPENFDYYIENNIPKALRSTSVALGNFGGSLDLSRFHGFEKFIVRIMRYSIKNAEESDDISENRAIPAILPENISRFADEVKRAYK